MCSRITLVLVVLWVSSVLCAEVLASTVNTWRPVANNRWNNGANWTLNTVPNAGHVATFDGSVSNVPCVMNAAVNVGGIDFRSNYSGTVTQGAHSVVVGSNNIVQAGGVFNGGAPDTLLDGLVGYWKLNESSAGSVAFDSSRFGNNGTPQGSGGVGLPRPDTEVPSVAFANPRSLSFDGVDDRVDTGDRPLLEGMPAVSVCAWVNIDRLPPQHYAVVERHSLYRIIIGSSGNGHMVVRTTNNGWYTAGTTAGWPVGTIVPGNWYHIVGTYDGNRTRVYVNGVLSGTGAQALSGAIATNSGSFRLGYKSASNIDYTDGKIDEVRVYNRALGIEEIQSLAGGSDTHETTAPANSISVNGSLTVSGGTFRASDEVSVSGVASVSGGTYRAGDGTSVVGGLAVSSGLFGGGGGSIDVDGNISLEAGATLTATSGETSVGGDWTNSGGVYEANGGTVTFDGTGASSIGGDNSFFNLTCSTPLKVLQFEAGSTQTIAGMFHLDGSGFSTRIVLRSALPGTAWHLLPQGGRIVSYVDVQDSWNDVPPNIRPVDSLDSGNNRNWFNRDPSGTTEAFTVAQATILDVAAPGVLGNDSDPDADALSAVLAAGPSHGTIQLNPNGSFIYTPDTDYHGTDTFYYQADDGLALSDVIAVTLTVTPTPVAPNPMASPSAVLAGETVVLSCNPVGGSGAYVSFQWSGSNGFTSSQQNPGVVSMSDAGIFTFTLTVVDSLGLAGTESITVIAIASALLPNAEISGALIALGDQFTLSCEPTGGTGQYTAYQWTGPGGFVSSLQNPGLVTPPVLGENTYTVTITDASGITASESVTVVAAEGIAPGRLALERSGVRYRALSDSGPAKPGDFFRLSVKGMQLSKGDRLSVSLNGKQIGDPRRGNGLTLDGKLRAEGQLLSGSPGLFFDAKLKYRTRGGRLRLVARGVYGGGPVVQSQSGSSDERLLTILVDRAPADGVVDALAFVPVRFRVKVTASREGVIRESGRSLKRR